MSVRVRFSPSPTGTLHMGSAHTALFNWLYARHHGGTFVVRVEDTDQARSTGDHATAVCATLRWLGLDWDEGPEVGGPFGPYNQMRRLPLYAEALERLKVQDAAYPCYCTPAELESRRELARQEGRAPRYDGHCAHLAPEQRQALEAEGRRAAWRLRVPTEGGIVVEDLIRGNVRFGLQTLDDFVIVRSDGIPTYNFAVVVDDALMQISHVLRADEHLANTPKQILVYRALGLDPPLFGHLPMILAADRTKLSKRHGAIAIEEFRELGMLPGAILNYCALLGWSPPGEAEVLTLQETVQAFDLDRVGASAAVYDVEKLRWMNAQHLRRHSPAAVAELARPWLERAGILPGAGGPPLEATVALVHERVQTLAELPAALEYFYRAPEVLDPAGERRWANRAGAELLQAAAAEIEALTVFSAVEMENCYRALALRRGIKAGELIHPTRLALTGRTVGPSLFDLAALVGRPECVRRLRATAERWTAEH